MLHGLAAYKKICKAFWESLPIENLRLAEGFQQLNFEYRWCQIECFHSNRLFPKHLDESGNIKGSHFSADVFRLILLPNLYLASDCFKCI